MGKDSLSNLKIFLGFKIAERKRNSIPWTVRFKLEVMWVFGSQLG